MRELLFRGKRCDNGEWIEGVPIKTYDTEIGMNLPLRYKPKNITLMSNDRVELCCAMDESAYFDTENYPIIDDETIGQYTGLKDVHNTRVFEADIVKVYDVYCNETVVGVVEFCDASFRIYDKDFTSYDRWMYYEVEVIGNIHDNPELMGGNTHG